MQSQILESKDMNIMTDFIENMGGQILQYNSPDDSQNKLSRTEINCNRKSKVLAEKKFSVILHLQQEEDLSFLMQVLYHWDI